MKLIIEISDTKDLTGIHPDFDSTLRLEQRDYEKIVDIEEVKRQQKRLIRLESMIIAMASRFYQDINRDGEPEDSGVISFGSC